MYDLAFKIIIFGDESYVKTILVNRYLTKVFDEDLKKTLASDFYFKDLTVNGKNTILRFWVLSGEQRFRTIVPSFIKGADGGLFVYDITDSSTLSHLDDWLSVIRKGMKIKQIKFPILAMGFLPDERDERKIRTEEGIEVAKSRNLKGFIECSPETGEKG